METKHFLLMLLPSSPRDHQVRRLNFFVKPKHSTYFLSLSLSCNYHLFCLLSEYNWPLELIKLVIVNHWKPKAFTSVWFTIVLGLYDLSFLPEAREATLEKVKSKISARFRLQNLFILLNRELPYSQFSELKESGSCQGFHLFLEF